MLKYALKSKDIRNRILFTLFMIFLYRVGANLPILGIDRDVLSSLYTDRAGIFDIYNLLSGGAFQNFTLFALGVSPYITASIIIQLLGYVFPSIGDLSKEGEPGKKKLEKVTVYTGVILALIQAIGITIGMFRQAVIGGPLNMVLVVLELTLGAGLLILISNLITKKGIGNGMSVIIFTGIVSRIITDVTSYYTKVMDGSLTIVGLLIFLLVIGLVVLGVVYIQEGSRKIPVTYAGHVVGNKKYRENRTFIPIKVNQGGVLPVIFALTILQAPVTLSYFFPNSGYSRFIDKYLNTSGQGFWVYLTLDILLIAFFTFFYSGLIFDPVETAKNIRSNGGAIPGIRPGRDTVEKLMNVTNSMGKVAALFLITIAAIPILLSHFLGISTIFGGTSAIIAVGVAVEVMNQINEKVTLERDYKLLK